MKILYILFTAFIIQLFCLSTNAQNLRKYECDGISSVMIEDVYYKFKEYGLPVYIQGDSKDFLLYMINKFSRQAITQICIESWVRSSENGFENSYQSFKKEICYLPKQGYKDNYQVLEIIRQMHRSCIANGGYKKRSKRQGSTSTKTNNSYKPQEKSYEKPCKYLKVTSYKAYFHNLPKSTTKRKAYLVIGTCIKPLDYKNGYAYIVFKNTRGQVSKGWISLDDVE